jgi:2-keto-3-deoxy-L-rhamnonate aldolase RhmA
MAPTFRARLRAGELLVGPMITLNSPEVVELLAELGFDWLFIDAEHTPIGPPEIQVLLRAAGRVPAIIRLPSAEATTIGKVLDSGAAGIIVAQVNSAGQAREIVAAARYAPAGRRGRGLARAHGYGLKLAEYSATANETVAVVVQAEHVDAVRNIREIVRVEGVDGVLVGPYDLASSLGRTGDVEHPDVKKAIAAVRAACFEAAMPIGILGLTADAVAPYIEQGFTLIIAGIDVLLIGESARTLLDRVRRIPQPGVTR